MRDGDGGSVVSLSSEAVRRDLDEAAAVHEAVAAAATIDTEATFGVELGVVV